MSQSTCLVFLQVHWNTCLRGKERITLVFGFLRTGGLDPSQIKKYVKLHEKKTLQKETGKQGKNCDEKDVLDSQKNKLPVPYPIP